MKIINESSDIRNDLKKLGVKHGEEVTKMIDAVVIPFMKKKRGLQDYTDESIKAEYGYNDEFDRIANYYLSGLGQFIDVR